MKVRNRQTWRLGLLLLTALVGICIRVAFRAQGMQQAVPQATLNHILNETERYCRALIPDEDVMHFAVYPSPVFQRSGAARSLWTVECLDEKGKEMAHILWDEDAKRCLSISRIPSLHIPASLPTFHRDVALDVARVWAGQLHVADVEEAKRAQAEMQNMGATWRVRLHLRDRDVTLWIDARSGELMRAATHELPNKAGLQTSDNADPDPVPHS